MALLIGDGFVGLNVWSWLQWGFDHEVTATNTTYEYATPGGGSVVITGHDFGYENGLAVDGIVETLTIFDDLGNEIATLSGLNVSLEELMANNLHDFWHVLLAGNDQIVLGDTDDTVSGFAGDDQIDGGGGDDNISGSFGNDQLNGGLGDDFVDGGAGNDEIIFDVENGNDTIYGGVGDDTVIHHGLQSDWPDIISISKIPAPYVALQVEKPFQFEGIKAMQGLPFGGKSAGSGMALASRDGGPARPTAPAKTAIANDLLQLPDDEPGIGGILGGKSVLSSNFAEWDVLLEVGSTTGSTIPDEPERTDATLRSIETVEIYGGAGNGSLNVDNLSGTALENGHILYDGGQGEDNLHAVGTGTAITYVWRFDGGYAGDATVTFGSSDQDTFHLIDHDDEGLNIILGETGTSVTLDEGVVPGIGPSDLLIRNAEHFDFDFGDGDDTVFVNYDLTGAYSGTLDIDFGEGVGDLDSTVHSGAVHVTGGDDGNSFFAGDGDDTLIGGALHDDLFGGGGSDTIFGGGEEDHIGGGAGNDAIFGGDGGDRFFFDMGDGTDTIGDFVAGDTENDRLDFISLGISMEELTITQVGDHTHVTTPFGDTVILENVNAGDLNNGDFML